MWFASVLENESAARTSRDTLWRKLQLNRSILLVCRVLLAHSRC